MGLITHYNWRWLDTTLDESFLSGPKLLDLFQLSGSTFVDYGGPVIYLIYIHRQGT